MTNPQFPNQPVDPAPAFPGSGAAPAAAAPVSEKASGRPSGIVLAGAGSLVAVLAFLGGMAVGHAWDGASTGTTTGPGGGFRQFPGQGQGQGGAPGQQVPPGQVQPGQGQSVQPSQGQPG
jgi:hypothetical protein